MYTVLGNETERTFNTVNEMFDYIYSNIWPEGYIVRRSRDRGVC